LDVYKLAEELADMVWHNHEGQISNFYFLISTFREQLQIFYHKEHKNNHLGFSQ